MNSNELNKYIKSLNNIESNELKVKLESFYLFNQSIISFFKGIDNQFKLLMNMSSIDENTMTNILNNTQIIDALINLKREILFLDEITLCNESEIIKILDYIQNTMVINEVNLLLPKFQNILSNYVTKKNEINDILIKLNDIINNINVNYDESVVEEDGIHIHNNKRTYNNIYIENNKLKWESYLWRNHEYLCYQEEKGCYYIIDLDEYNTELYLNNEQIKGKKVAETICRHELTIDSSTQIKVEAYGYGGYNGSNKEIILVNILSMFDSITKNEKYFINGNIIHEYNDAIFNRNGFNNGPSAIFIFDNGKKANEMENYLNKLVSFFQTK